METKKQFKYNVISDNSQNSSTFDAPKTFFDNQISGGSSILTIEEVSAWLKVKPKTLYSMVHRCDIPFLKVGRLLRFEKKAIEEWLTSKRR
ncbi:MAG: helix-turn-helix domain-containing protein [Oligoflexia bacterium]|nr:helix-turn-helix domain-containing protein [Oligoflexia bacterium]